MHSELIGDTAEGFYLVGGGFSMKHGFCALCTRKSLIQQAQSSRRTGSRTCVNYILSWDATGKKKSRKTFHVFEIEESEKTFDSERKNQLYKRKMKHKLLVLSRPGVQTATIEIYEENGRRNVLSYTCK